MREVIKEIESGFTPDHKGKAAFAQNGMVATAFPDATMAGVHCLKAGGNAIDAAVASALALGVCEPCASGLGGQTMMMIAQGKKILAVDGSSRAPSLAHVNAVYKEDRSLGYRASTVPSTLATLWYVQDRYGELPWKKVVEPAIQIASDGYKITDLQHKLLIRERDKFLKVSNQSGLRCFYKNGEPYKSGEVFKQTELAGLLKIIANTGIDDFYKGKVAKIIDADMRENGGLLRYDDLALVPYPIERTPLMRTYKGFKIYSMPPPGSGRTLLFALMMLNQLPKKMRFSNEIIHHFLMIKVLRKAFLERSDRPFDPHFFPQEQEESRMLDPVFARECLREILKEVDKTTLPLIPTEDEVSGETTHLSVIDKSGMAVSLTQSIERVYGSKAAADGLGFLYNNYLYDFEYNMPEHPFYLRPNKSPWATVAPTLVFHDHDIWMALGSPGSERIISVLAQFLQSVIQKKQPIDQAMKAPRLHCSLGGRVSLEAKRFNGQLIPFLREKGFRIDEREDYAFYLGCIQAVLKCHDGSGFQGIADIRRDGTAAGLS